MAAFEVGFYWGTHDDGTVLIAMVPMTEEAHDIFVEKFGMPADCNGIDVGDYDPFTVIEMLPRKFLFGNTKDKPTMLHKYLFYDA